MLATDLRASLACPPDLRAAYDVAATEADREAAAMAIAMHYAALSHAEGIPYPVRYEDTGRYCHWHGVAGGHRARAIAERVPSPYDRPLLSPRDAAARYLWAYRAWSLENVLRAPGGAGGGPDGWDVREYGGRLEVTRFGGKPCAVKIGVAALWAELFGAPDGTVQIPLFAADTGGDLDDLELMEDTDD